MQSSDAVLSLYSDAVANYRSAITLGEITGGVPVTKWSTFREPINAGNDLQFRFGPSNNYAANDMKFEVRDTGDIWSAGQLFQNSSGRNKENIEEIRGAVKALLELRGVRYTWKDDGQPDIGFIAEDMARVLPEIVDFGENGEPLGIDYGRVTALLVEATKDQQGEIEALRGIVESLLGRIEALEARGGG